MEASSDDVVHPACRHPVEGGSHHRESVVVPAAEEELESGGGRELRRAAEAAERGLERARDPASSLAQDRLGQRLRGRSQLGAPPQRLVDLPRLALDLDSPLVPCARDRLEQVAEAREPVPRLGREIRAGVERLSLRRHEDGRRPAAGARHPDGRLHRQRIDVRPLLTVDLDVDEQLVHERSGVRILERLVRHHVAPVARAVTDRDEERLLLGAGELERLVSPRMPVHGVLGMLQEVGAGLAGQAIHLTTVRS